MQNEILELRRQLVHEIQPQGVIEQALFDEILAALVRLRRCAQRELALDPDTDEAAQAQKEIDRQRTLAHALLLRSNAELRRLRKDRPETAIDPAEQPEATPVPDPNTPRGAQCPCGSGLKYKRCHGWNAPAAQSAKPSANLRNNILDHFAPDLR